MGMLARYYRDLLVKYGWMILLGMSLAGAVAAVVSFVAPQAYDARATVLVDIPSPNANLLADASSYVDTQARQATNPTVLTALASTHTTRTPDQLAHEITAARVGTSQFLEITVRDADPNEAVSLANDTAMLLVQMQRVALAAANNEAQTPINSEISSAQAEVNSASSMLAQLQGAKANAIDIAVAQAHVLTAQQRLQNAEDALSQLKLYQAEQLIILRVTQPALTSTPARASLFSTVSAAVTLGFLIGLVAVIARVRFARAPLDAQYMSRLTGLPILANLTLRPDALSSQGAEAEGAELAGAITVPTAAGMPRAIAFIGAGARGGSYLTARIAAEYALASASLQRNTLLVDADVARPSQDELFGIAPGAGLTDMAQALQQGRLPADAVARYTSPSSKVHAPWLRVLAAGFRTPSPGRLLSSDAMGAVFSRLADLPVDVIVIGGPLATEFSGAEALAARADTVVVTADRDSVRPQELLRATQLLLERGARIQGMVLAGGLKRVD
jgi:capsular polysaccharide biosynthesis protein